MEVGFLSVEIILCFLLLLLSTVSYADINLGSSLQPTSNQNINNNNIWKSPNGNFSLQFIPVSSSSFSVAITFTGVPIWKAGGGESGVVDSNSRFDFLNDGNLRLINGSETIIWESNTTKLGITTATLDDSGNLSLKNGNTTVWSTFQNPTDTIVPFQNFSTRNVLTSGNYSFALNSSSGHLTLRWNNEVIYWKSSFNSTLTSPVLRILPIGIIQINGTSIFYGNDLANTGEDSSILRFIKLDSDGNLRFYSSVRGSGRAVERWAAVSDQCRVYGFCGNMGICSYNKEHSNISCSCPSENFEFTDENDPRKGCKRKVETVDCPGNTIMLQLDNTQFLTYEPELSTQVFSAGLSGCSSNCLNNPVPCQASTAVGDGSGLCYFKTSSFISGYQSLALRSVSFVKVCRPEMPNRLPSPLNEPPIQTYKLHVWAFVMIAFATLVVLVLLEGGLWFWCCRNSS